MDRRSIGAIAAEGLDARRKPEYKDWSEVIATGHICRECRVLQTMGVMLKHPGVTYQAAYVCYDCACPAPEKEEPFEAPDQGADTTRQATAEAILQIATTTLYDRGKHYASDKERNMGLIVELFNKITGRDLSTRDGWNFMLVLKLVRACQDPTFKLDHYVDLAGYAALAGEEGLKHPLTHVREPLYNQLPKLEPRK